MLKRKRQTSHDTEPPRLRPFEFSKSVWAVRSSREQIVETGRGWLDGDGVFYEMPEGQIIRGVPLGRLWDMNYRQKPLLVYAHMDALRETGIRMQRR